MAYRCYQWPIYVFCKFICFLHDYPSNKEKTEGGERWREKHSDTQREKLRGGEVEKGEREKAREKEREKGEREERGERREKREERKERKERERERERERGGVTKLPHLGLQQL